MKEPHRNVSTRQKVQGFVLVMFLVAMCIPLFNVGWWGVISSAIVGIGVIFWLTGRGKALVAWVIFLFLAGLIIPAIFPAAPAARRMVCANRLREIAAAIAAYESDHGCLPPPFTVSATGERLHSWRVLILPYLGRKDLYHQIDLNKPWNDPANLAIGDHMPEDYSCPEAVNRSPWWTVGNLTYYVAVVGSDTAWPSVGVRHGSELDSDSHSSILVIESSVHEQHWMAPTDPTLQKFLDSYRPEAHGESIYNHAVCNDGGVRRITEEVTPNVLRDLLTTNSTAAQ